MLCEGKIPAHLPVKKTFRPLGSSLSTLRGNTTHQQPSVHLLWAVNVFATFQTHRRVNLFTFASQLVLVRPEGDAVYFQFIFCPILPPQSQTLPCFTCLQACIVLTHIKTRLNVSHRRFPQLTGKHDTELMLQNTQSVQSVLFLHLHVCISSCQMHAVYP